MKLRTWLQGAGVAAIVLFPFYRDVLSKPGYLRMHTPVPALALALSVVVNLLLVSFLFALLGSWLPSTSGWRWLRYSIPALVLVSLAEMAYIAGTGWESTRLGIGVLLVTLFLTILLRLRWHRAEQMLLQLSGAILVGLGFFCIFVLVQLLRWAVWHPSPNFVVETSPAAIAGLHQPRIVWILFDEMSYQQVFGERYPGLQLPTFDNLRKSSTVFADTQPIANFTELAIPSILLGQPIDRVTDTTGNQVQVGRTDGPLLPFDAARTPFAMARNRGLTTGVVGWYNPYCGMLAPYLNQCYWTNEFLGPSVFGEKDYFWRDLSRPWVVYRSMFGQPWRLISRDYRNSAIQSLLVPEPGQDAGNRIVVYQDLIQHAQRMLGPSGPDFVFFHFSIPHPSGLYNRKTQQLDLSGQRSYLDNLALADKTLGELLEILQKSPRWKNTSVVICGDHSWRVYMWTGASFWTPEDEAASHGGVFDPRPLLMVHLAGQTTPATVTEPFPLLRVHDILNDLVTGKQPTFPVH